MKFTLISSILILILGITISSMIYAESPFKIGNKADIIEFEVRIIFFCLLFLVSVISYITLHYAFKLNDAYILVINNIGILMWIIFTSEELKNPQLLIYYPVFLILSILFWIYNNFKRAPLK